MLIQGDEVKQYFDKYGITIQGILHVGAHECEEKGTYNNWGVKDKDIVWIDANENLVKLMTSRGVPNCYYSVLDETEHDAVFKVTNNSQASSLLTLGLCKTLYPYITVTEERNVHTQTLTNFFKTNHLDASTFNVWNFDIQGSELHVFRGSEELLKYADAIYTEVNVAHVYENSGLISELDELLLKHGLVRVCTRMTESQWGDALYIREKKPLA